MWPHEVIGMRQLHQQQRSLSPAVQDALFSYWRLPQCQRLTMEAQVPSMGLAPEQPLQLRTDWAAFASRLTSCQAPEAVRPTEMAWAIALQAESLVNQAQQASFWRSDALRRLGVTHSAQLERLVDIMSDECGDFYLSFTVLITILERALYDVYHEHEEQTATVNGSSKTPVKKKKNLILRDLLQSETLQRVLPDGLLQLLKILFLPSGLNLRNLVWHGFVIPADVPKCWGALTFVLIVAVAEYLSADEDTHSSSLFSIHACDTRFVLDDSSALPKWTRGSLDSLIEMTTSSRFVPSGRMCLVERALRALLIDQDELLFLFVLLPVLEHAVRLEFLRLNQLKYDISSEYGCAQIDAYYSTLDGFGQREKHQVLLHPRVLLGETGSSSDDTRSINALYGDLPVASLAVWLDLFMMASGPNLRAKLCHGEASLATLLQPRAKEAHSMDDRPPISVASRLVLCSWLAVCDHKRKSAENGSSEQALASTIDPFVASYSSSFHPFFQLRRALSATQLRVWDFAVFRQRWSALRMVPSGGDGDEQVLMRVEFLHADLVNDEQPFSLTDKVSRIDVFRALFANNLPLKPRSDGFVSLLVELKQTLETVSTVLTQHFEKYHKDHYLHEGPSCTLLSQDLIFHANVVADGIHEVELPLPRSLEALMLALGDEEGLSAASCMMEIILSCTRSLDTFKQRFEQLHAMIRAGTARTNHRRSFLRSVFFIPVFEQLQLVCLSLVEHQIVYLAARATRESMTNEEQASSKCPCDRQVENVQTKLLQFVTAFEGCTGSAEASQKSSDKALQLAVQFLNSKAIKSVLRASI